MVVIYEKVANIEYSTYINNNPTSSSGMEAAGRAVFIIYDPESRNRLAGKTILAKFEKSLLDLSK